MPVVGGARRWGRPSVGAPSLLAAFGGIGSPTCRRPKPRATDHDRLELIDGESGPVVQAGAVKATDGVRDLSPTHRFHAREGAGGFED